MSYIEDAVYSFIKGIFTKGVVVLTNKRFVTYTIISMLLPIILTVYTFIKGGEASMVYSLIFNFELATCMALVITGLISLKLQMIKIEHAFFFTILLLLYGLSFINKGVTNAIESIFAYVGFYSWIITTNVATLSAIRDFVVSWPGWIVRLGDAPDKIMFGSLVKVGLFASIIWFIYSLWTNFSWSLFLAFLAGAAVYYTIYIFLPVTKDGTMASIISFYYLFSLYHLFVRAESSTGFLFLDILIIVASTIFTAQGISNLIASKKYAFPYNWDSLIILLLGFMLGYHMLAVKIALISGLKGLYSLYHDIAFGFGTLMIYALLLLYASKKEFRDFSKERITVGYAAKQLTSLGLDAVNNYLSNLKETIRKKNWAIELKKNKKGKDVM